MADIAALRLAGDIAKPAAVAEALETTVPALAQMRYRGTGPPYTRIAGRVRYRWSQVERYLVEQTVEPNA